MARRFLTRTLLVILIACCAYNGYQVQHLQAEVDALKGRNVSVDDGLDWKDAQHRLGVLQTQVETLRRRADHFWHTHSQNGRS